MALSLRTATKGVLASGATGSITLPTGTTTGDIIVVAFANAGTSGPAKPAGWTAARTTDSAGTGQSLTIFFAPFSAGLTLSFVNAASVTAWTCQTVTGAPNTTVIDTTAATSNTTNNTTLPTGAPTTGAVAGDVELLFYAFTSAATISAVAAGSTIDATQANSTSITCIIGHNNTIPLGAGAAPTAFSQTLSASNTRKTGVGVNVKLAVPVTATPPTTALTLATFAPVVHLNKIATPATLALTTSAFAPVVSVTNNVRATPGTLALTTIEFAPTVAAPRLVTPGTKALSLTLLAPTVLAPRVAIPGTDVLALTGLAPTVQTPRLVTPPTKALVTTSFASAVATPRLVTPGTDALALTLFASSVATPCVVTPETGALALTGLAPAVSTPVVATPGILALHLATFAPTVSVTTGGDQLVVPGTTALVLTTFAPTVVDPLTPTVVVVSGGRTSDDEAQAWPTSKRDNDWWDAVQSYRAQFAIKSVAVAEAELVASNAQLDLELEVMAVAMAV